MNIRELRINANLTTDKASKLLPCSKSMLYKVEQGIKTPSTRLIKRMAQVYNCTIDDIFNALEVIKNDKS